ncbi:hypothetical protein [Pseudonocardia sp. UM4_GMWB1]
MSADDVPDQPAVAAVVTGPDGISNPAAASSHPPSSPVSATGNGAA